MKLAGLDFETANPYHGSICSAGIAILEDGELKEQREFLIRPHKDLYWMLPAFTDVHGISYHDVKESPEFVEVWEVIKRMIQSADLVIIHNAAFDLRHLRMALALYQLPDFSFSYACSLALSRHFLPDLERHSLDAVAAHFGIEFEHHDALADAITCATIASKLTVPENFRKTFEYHKR